MTLTHIGSMTSLWHDPPELRRRLHLDQPGAQAWFWQAWFWQPEWQQREREVDRHVTAGRVETHDSTEDFLVHLNSLEGGHGH